MFNARILMIATLGIALAAPALYAQDLSSYREFKLGAALPAVAKQVRMKPAAARTIHKRPALIQELEWEAQTSYGAAPSTDPVKGILFSFYNGELFRLVVTYEAERTEGLTVEDMIESISAKYGTATRPATEIILSSTQLYGDGEKSISDRSEKVIARWEDAQYSFNLFQPAYRATFGLLVYAKRLDGLAQAAIVEATRLDAQEAPQREIARQDKKDAENRVKQEKARRENKGPFRP